MVQIQEKYTAVAVNPLYRYGKRCNQGLRPWGSWLDLSFTKINSSKAPSHFLCSYKCFGLTFFFFFTLFEYPVKVNFLICLLHIAAFCHLSL
jgi:hypothetical protein